MRVNSVCTWATKPGITMVFTLVPVISRPWMTSGDTKRSVTGRPWRDRDAARHEHELRGDGPHRDAAVRADRRSEVVLGELARQVQRLGVDALHVAGRIDVPGQRREHDHAQRGGDEHADPERPQQFGAENSPLVRLGGCCVMAQPTAPRGRKTSR